MRLRPSILVPLVSLVLGACGGGSDSTGTGSTPTSPGTPSTPSTPATPVATNQVTIGNDFFDAANITVPVNTTVHWTWGSEAITHNVTFNDGPTSGDKSAGGTFDRTFGTAGTFSYRCTIHAVMTGTVLVTP